MSLPPFIHVHDHARNVISGPMETWISLADISRFGVSCNRTPTVKIYLRSEPAEPVIVNGDTAKNLIELLRGLKK